MPNRSVRIRNYTTDDIPPICVGVVEHLLYSRYGSMSISLGGISDFLHALIDDPTAYVGLLVNQDDEPVGGICAVLNRFIFNDVPFAEDQLLYIIPEYRSFKAARLLIDSYVEWATAKDAYCARLMHTTNLDGFDKLAERFGFEKIGTVHEKVLQL